VQINPMYLPFRLLNTSAPSFNYSKVMSERTVTSSTLTAANEVEAEILALAREL
jgi:beta-lactamase regulating signal transducer with metallopeptidase domain